MRAVACVEPDLESPIHQGREHSPIGASPHVIRHIPGGTDRGVEWDRREEKRRSIPKAAFGVGDGIEQPVVARRGVRRALSSEFDALAYVCTRVSAEPPWTDRTAKQRILVGHIDVMREGDGRDAAIRPARSAHHREAIGQDPAQALDVHVHDRHIAESFSRRAARAIGQPAMAIEVGWRDVPVDDIGQQGLDRADQVEGDRTI